VGEEPDLPQSAKEALYRVAQEALQNAVKHARARTLDVVLELQGAQVGLMVADDGRGLQARVPVRVPSTSGRRSGGG
jgi:two-component system NarL family sensor kinase